MPIPVDTKNDALDGLGFTHASLHTAWPGATGANEVNGGSYARQAIDLTAASGGIRSLDDADTSFSVPGGTTVRWVGFWDGDTYRIAAPNGGATPKNFMAVPTSDRVFSTAHGWNDGQKVTFFNGTPPGGLTEGAIYYVVDGSTDSFKVSATSGGDPINLTSASSFGCVVAAITEDVYDTSGTHQLTSGTVAIPD
jgi:hypothetical protein